MKKAMAIACIVLIGALTSAAATSTPTPTPAPVTAPAQTRYVTDSIRITLRTGPALDRKIIAMLESGQPVTVVESDNDWTHIRLPDGRDGWILTRFLQDDTPLKDRLAALQKRYDDLVTSTGDPMKEIARLTDENNTLKTDLEKSQRNYATLQRAHTKLKATAAEATTTRDQRDRLLREVTALNQKIAATATDLSHARQRRNLWWFISGAGVLAVGFAFGLMLRPKRRRSSLY
jgi:SH3 domain protein